VSSDGTLLNDPRKTDRDPRRRPSSSGSAWRLGLAAFALSSRQGSSHRQTRTLLWVGFGGLLLLLGLLGLSAISFLYQIEIRQEQIRQDFVERDRTLERLRSSIFLSGTWIRDFLLDTSETAAAGDKTRFLETRSDIEQRMNDYRRLLRPPEKQAFAQLNQELADYLGAVSVALDWTAEERHQRGYALIQEQVLPRRMMAVGLADRIEQMSQQQLETSSADVSELFASFRLKLLALLLLTVAAGIVLAGVSLWRLFRLENEAQFRFREVLKAREELARLSAELVSAQESERRRISRELHDEIGQILSAIMLALGNLRSAIQGNNMDEALRQVQFVEDMTSRNVSMVRNLSLLLRPTMLDDLGLIPALRWLAREVSRTAALQVEVAAVECPDDLPEEHRTCVFRVVQEAVRNASRHSGARQARIFVSQLADRLRVSVQDDGRGFDPGAETGLGILGMEERVVRLGGNLHVDSERGRGTIVWFELPLPATQSEVQKISPLRTA
jgi:signal transduction histidine kinase